MPVSVTGGDRFRVELNKVAAGITNAKSVEIGFLEGKTYDDGTPVPLVAAMNEFGHVIMPPGSTELSKSARAKLRKEQIVAKAVVPPRPFFRNMIRTKSKEWPEGIRRLMRANKLNAHDTLEIFGAVVKGQLQESINELFSPPLAPSTIARKGFDKPLIDSSLMLNSVDYVVGEESQ